MIKRRLNFKGTFIGLIFTSFYSYLPYLASLIFISGNKNIGKFKRKLFVQTILLSIVLFISFIFTQNINVFRILGLIILNFIIYSLIFNSKSNVLNFHLLPNRLFWIHSIIIFIAFLSPRVNTLLTSSEGETNRIGGLVGYDYMAFFYCTYLFAELRSLRFSTNFYFVLKFILSGFFILISGRFGIIILLYLTVFLFFRKINFIKIFSIVILSSISIIVFFDQISFIVASYKGFFTYLIDSDTSDLRELSSQDSDAGYYSASPITWVNMFIKPFQNFTSYIFPSRIELTVDPGPSYLILNIGILISIWVYVYFVNFFKVKNKIFWPLFIVYILTDIKFHGIFVPASMFWVYLNIYKINISKISA